MSELHPWPYLLLLAGSAAACHDDTTCDERRLFGRPNDKTGLSAALCEPRCACSATPFAAPAYGSADVERALAWTLLDPPAPLTADPYAAPAPAEVGPDVVCGVLPDPPGSRTYRLVTYDDERAARAAGAFPSHFGACGLCSPLVDLAVYMGVGDLTQPVRQCGLDWVAGPPASHIQCLQDLGFDYACAQIWYYNTLHTREACLEPCMNNFNTPYNLADGSLNDCLACDERESGPVFKAVAGRTRRNTGIANAICRPCSEVQPLVHDYL